jgi:hypothetical protein
MRSLEKNEIGQVSGGYYFYSTIQGAQAGAILGYGAFLCTQTTFALAIGTGIAIGSAFGLLNGLAFDLDVSLLSQYYINQISAESPAN